MKTGDTVTWTTKNGKTFVGIILEVAEEGTILSNFIRDVIKPKYSATHSLTKIQSIEYLASGFKEEDSYFVEVFEEGKQKPFILKPQTKWLTLVG